jgi:predicted Zn-dependent protease
LAPPAPSTAKASPEDAYRANNLGVALLEQFDYPAAAEAFRRAVALDPALGLARLNLAIALYNARDLEGAQREARLAAGALPDRPHPHYVLGLVAKAENRTDDAIAAFQRVTQMDAADVGGNVNLGQMYMQVRRYPDAIGVFRAAVAAEPYSQTAVYNLGIALTRAGERAEGEKVMERFKALRDSGYRTVLGQNYLEQGRYAEALSSTGAEADLVSRETPAVKFTDASADALPAELRASSGRARPRWWTSMPTARSTSWSRTPGACACSGTKRAGSTPWSAASSAGDRTPRSWEATTTTTAGSTCWRSARTSWRCSTPRVRPSRM